MFSWVNHSSSPWVLAAALVTQAPLSLSLDDVGLEEVVVRAQHRDQSLLDVPITVTVLAADQLDHLGVRNIEAVANIAPGLSGWEQGVSTPIYAIRGISSNSFGIGGEASVALIVDDSYVGRINSSSATLLDVERIEVLKGPQGTLFGRNSTAGAILVYSQKPQPEASAKIQLQAGDYQQRDSSLIVNLPISEHVFLRANGFYFSQDGDVENIIYQHDVGDEQSRGGKLALRYLVDDLDITLSYADQQTKTGGLGYETLNPQLAAVGGVAANPYDDVLATDTDTYDNVNNRDARLAVAWQLNEQLALQSITAYHQNQSPNLFDVDGSALFLTSAGFIARDSETLSQEFRFNGQHGDVDWVAGAIAFKEKVSNTIELRYSDINALAGRPGPGFTLCDATSTALLGPCQAEVQELAYQQGDYLSYGAFVDGSWSVTERLTVSAGLRYSYDHKQFKYRSSPVNSVTSIIATPPGATPTNLVGYSNADWNKLHQDWDDWQPRVAVNYSFSDQHQLYASASQGYKAGGFEPEASADLSVFKPESVNSFDVGVRGETVDQGFSYQAALFAYDYRDYQVQIFENGISRTINADGVDGRGVELELNTRFLRYGLAQFHYAYTHSEFKSQQTDKGNLKGNATILTPEHSAWLNLEVKSPLHSWGSAGVSWQTRFQDEIYFSIINSDNTRQGAYTLSNVSISYYTPNNRWQLDLLAENVFDKSYLIYKNELSAGVVARRGAPRTMSLRLVANW